MNMHVYLKAKCTKIYQPKNSYVYYIVGAVMSEKGVRWFFRGKSNLKTDSDSMRGVLSGIQCCQQIFSTAT